MVLRHYGCRNMHGEVQVSTVDHQAPQDRVRDKPASVYKALGMQYGTSGLCQDANQ